ncbi:hypothetical protein K493DRAFT_88353 [Basidiobolus meristosporus CBS 931.73]|uniref:Uncharacterized protein n=1 Tax=Basidiobolus meristosporus CBS 931.73 TaxID=1314790 RepID=A0A1Y1XDX6_9FUNG|nr:hypothetical protein K493DRAFT_88353 [Basidiobolus meristosporus CBS 931.73]|eukprot:ORX83917.1 hypothetical protein K493DRAFT_88353 [Basidiobolus meristosporus CBS 931.73]
MRTVALVVAFFGLAVSATQFSLECGSSAQKCASSLSLGTRSCYVSGTTVQCTDKNVNCQYQGWPNYTNCKSCSLIQCRD